MTEDADDDFRSAVAGQFSRMEQEYGQEGYQANIESQKASTAGTWSTVRHNNAVTLMLHSKMEQRAAITAVLLSISRLVIIAAVPPMIMFWVYLFKMWVL